MSIDRRLQALEQLERELAAAAAAAVDDSLRADLLRARLGERLELMAQRIRGHPGDRRTSGMVGTGCEAASTSGPESSEPLTDRLSEHGRELLERVLALAELYRADHPPGESDPP